MEVRRLASHPGSPAPGDIGFSTEMTRCWVGLRAGLEKAERSKIMALSEIGFRPSHMSLYQLRYSENIEHSRAYNIIVCMFNSVLESLYVQDIEERISQMQNW
jgi:hypothetical protein